MTPTASATEKSPKWRRRPEHRPQQIIEAALEVFGECGLAKTRLQDIAARAGVSKGTIYLYFPNKEELFREMIRQTAVAKIALAEKITAEGTPTQQLCAAMRGYWNFVCTPVFSTIHRLVLGELHQFPDLAEFYANEVTARGLKLLSGIIRRGVETGEFREIDPMVAARMLVALTVMNGIWRDKHTGVPLLCHKKDEDVFRELAHFYLHSLTTPAGASAQADGAPSDAASLIPFNND
ncbi:MAG TPA: TetR/AcrR family transcriptional regulator [Gemmatimonadaceae bacterium]|jgi:AcrR family transcriptional regulator|nr:TetR/AcrR family transcriptional regulator [Gemmatimonadaceae bacterium]